ncbi:TAXI family TRAP transporter solute-binding subunit [Oceanospirillum sp.]|uniref:TAXI family TRAP transporter solute-binding subunit n=1 Tax=Oceanospirillum sp. TaxID=2021254 RepID=UPI003A94C76F
MRRFLSKCLAGILLVITPVTVIADEPSFITVGTGDITGVYYPVGGAICRLLNKELDRHGIRCVVESTPGSAYNLKALRRGSLDLAIVQSDWLFHATRGSSIYTATGADTDLRSLLTLHTEDFTIVVRSDSGIESLEDLRGKRVNLGDPGSGQRNTMDFVLSELGWSYKDLENVSELQASEMPLALCSGQIDAFIYYVGHPNTSVGEATTFCDSRLIPLPQTLIKRFSEKYPFYRAGKIKGGAL